MLLGMLFAAWSGNATLFRKSLTLHTLLANVFLLHYFLTIRIFVQNYSIFRHTHTLPTQISPGPHGFTMRHSEG